jgi:hypothetical protein
VILMLVNLLLTLVLAATVAVYVAYPHRGQEVPRASWIGEAMRRGVHRLPTLDNQRERQNH